MVKNWLLIDTCCESGFVAWASDDQMLFCERYENEKQGAQKLPALLSEAIKREKLTLDNLGAVAVTDGPGSYTGLRVGMMFAKALAFALQLPLIGVASLYTIAPAASSELFYPLLDARSGGVYTCRGEQHADSISFDEPHVVSWEAFIESLPPEATLVTPHKDQIEKRFAADANTPKHDVVEALPSPTLLLQAARQRLENGEYPTRPNDLQIRYLRDATA